jgi:hypothetical protein
LFDFGVEFDKIEFDIEIWISLANCPISTTEILSMGGEFDLGTIGEIGIDFILIYGAILMIEDHHLFDLMQSIGDIQLIPKGFSIILMG